MNTSLCVPPRYASILIGAIVACWLIAAGTAQAQWAENFDSYASGSQVHGQGGWKGWDNAAGAGALVSSAFAFSGANSIAIAGGSDLVRQYSGYTSGLRTYSTRQYIPASLTTGTSYFILLNTYNDTGPYNWSIQTTFDLAANNLTETMGTSTSPSILRDQWVELAYQVNLTANTVTSFYNGVQFSSHAWQDGTGVNAIGAVDLFANGAGAVYYDNLSLTVVPEPSTIGLLLLGGFAILIRARKRA